MNLHMMVETFILIMPTPHIKNNIIDNNYASYRGRGIYKQKGRQEDIPSLFESKIQGYPLCMV